MGGGMKKDLDTHRRTEKPAAEETSAPGTVRRWLPRSLSPPPPWLKGAKLKLSFFDFAITRTVS